MAPFVIIFNNKIYINNTQLWSLLISLMPLGSNTDDHELHMKLRVSFSLVGQMLMGIPGHQSRTCTCLARGYTCYRLSIPDIQTDGCTPAVRQSTWWSSTRRDQPPTTWCRHSNVKVLHCPPRNTDWELSHCLLNIQLHIEVVHVL